MKHEYEGGRMSLEGALIDAEQYRPELKVGELTVRAMPGQPMTRAELEAQCQAVSEAAEATDYFTDDELERGTRC